MRKNGGRKERGRQEIERKQRYRGSLTSHRREREARGLDSPSLLEWDYIKELK
jgi:hypothetical protein